MKITKRALKPTFPIDIPEEDCEGGPSGLDSGVLGGNVHGGDIGNSDFYAPGDNRVPGALFKKPLKRKKKLFESAQRKASSLNMFQKTDAQKLYEKRKAAVESRALPLIFDYLSENDLYDEDKVKLEEKTNTMSYNEAITGVVNNSRHREEYYKLAKANFLKYGNDWLAEMRAEIDNK